MSPVPPARDSAPDVPGPLTGVVVIDLSRAVAGPHAAMMLGDLGAQVIKVETPGAGDDSRGWGPPFAAGGRESTYFLSANRNKQSIALDLKDDAGRETALRLIDRADVVVENFRTGVMDRLGLGLPVLHARNPRLVVLSITGFGHDGPEAGRAGYDQIAQGEGGFMSITGSCAADPQKAGVPIADLLAGMNGAYGVLAALLERERTGRGKVVRTSLLASVVGAHGYQGTRWTVAGVAGHADGNHHPSLAPYGLFPCADGLVQIAVGSDRQWRTFCSGFGIADDGDLATNAGRVQQGEGVRALVQKTFADWPVDPLLERLGELGIPAGRLRTLPQVYAWDQTRSQHLVVEVEHQSLGAIELPGSPLRMFDPDGAETTRRHHQAPPVLDADARETRRWLGDLEEEGPVARPSTPRLSRTGIRDEALLIIDTEGLAALSMRRLADRLGVQAASLYSHYANKDTVLDAIANLLARQVDVSAFERTWQDGIRVWATTYYAAICRHPNAAPIVAGGPRNRQDYLEMSDRIHGGLLRHGWPPRHATLVAASAKYLVLGAATTPFGSGFADDTAVYLGRYPNLSQAHLIRQVADRIDRDSFELSLGCLIHGLEQVHERVHR